MDEQVRHVRVLLSKPRSRERRSLPRPALTPPAHSTKYLFRQEGDYWTISYDETVFRLKHVRGLSYIVHLLQQPHQELHVFDLTALANPPVDRLSALPGGPSL